MCQDFKTLAKCKCKVGRKTVYKISCFHLCLLVGWLAGLHKNYWSDYIYSYILHSINMHVIVPVLKSFATFGPVFMILDPVVPPQISIPQLNA